MGRALHDITDFTMGDMAACSYALRQTAKGASSMEEVADRVVHYLYDHLTHPKTQETPLALVRLFKTHPYEQLDSELQEVARKILGGKPKSPRMKCWTLLATMGTKLEWQARKLSKRYRVIPFASEESVAQLPMLSNMVSQFGLEIPDVVLEPDPTLLADLSERTYNVFYVPEVAGSSYIPSQEEFVRPNGIRSCLGFGGMLPSGNVFAVIMFSTVPIPRQTASMFKSVSLSVKTALLPFESKVAGLEQLLEVQERSVIEQSERLEEAQRQLKEKNKQLEEALRQLKEAQNQLIMHEKMASLGQLVASVAHEINTPLGSINSNEATLSTCVKRIQQILAQDDCPAAVRENRSLARVLRVLDEISQVNENASARIVSVVSALRNFARLDEAEFQEADLHQGLDSTLSLVQHVLKNRVAVVRNYGKIPTISCFPNQLNQVFMNLLINSAQAIEDEGTITITTWSRGGAVCVQFTDNGKGISAEHIPRIFDPGFTTKGVGVGVGLGLSVSYSIVEKHSGHIDVESTAGEGSVFTVLLPIKSAP